MGDGQIRALFCERDRLALRLARVDRLIRKASDSFSRRKGYRVTLRPDALRREVGDAADAPNPRHPAARTQENAMPEYKVTVEGSDPIPVQAPNQTAARNHAVRQKVKVEKLTIADAIQFGKDGIDLQVAGEEAAETAEGEGAGES